MKLTIVRSADGTPDHFDLAAGNRCAKKICSGYKTVSGDRMIDRMQLFDRLDHDSRCPDPMDLRSGLVQEIGDINDLRVAGGIGDDGPILREDRP